jgi:para-nitrobenzyl esterase
VAADEVMAGMSAHTERWGLIAHRRILMAPMVDGDTLPTDPWTALRAGAARDVALVVGHTRHEHRLFALLEGTLGQVTEEQATAAVSLFAPGRAAAYADGSPEERHDRVHSDWLFRMPSQHLAEAHTGHTWLYELTWPGALGACHGLDVPLVFGNLTSGQPAQLLGGDLTEAAIVSEQLRGAWTGFATTGDPSWPRYDQERRLTRIFDTTAEVIPYPEEASRRAWRDHVFSPLHLT